MIDIELLNWIDIKKKYNLNSNANTREYQSKFLTKVGIKNLCIGNYFNILDDSLFLTEWIISKEYPDFEVCKEGYVRNKKTKKIYTATNSNGYIYMFYQGSQVLAHRIILQTFNPRDDYQSKTVDHINGKRTDNRLKNLRWVDHNENMHYRKENRQEIDNEINKLIQKYGYETTLQKIRNL